eukprot:5582047-Pyramimonas_sp.AAC.1
MEPVKKFLEDPEACAAANPVAAAPAAGGGGRRREEGGEEGRGRGGGGRGRGLRPFRLSAPRRRRARGRMQEFLGRLCSLGKTRCKQQQQSSRRPARGRAREGPAVYHYCADRQGRPALPRLPRSSLG